MGRIYHGLVGLSRALFTLILANLTPKRIDKRGGREYTWLFPKIQEARVDNGIAATLGFLIGLLAWGVLTFSNPISLKGVRSPLGLIWWAIKVAFKGFWGMVLALIILMLLK